MTAETKKKDFFVSHNGRDAGWAQWIAWELEAAGYTTVIQAWDFGTGSNFVLEMQKAAAGCERTIGVLSENSLSAQYVQQEWAAALVNDPTGAQRKLLLVRIAECKPDGLLKAIVYTDLVGLDEAVARERLFKAVAPGRAKPAQKPAFPGASAQAALPSKPAFPGNTPAQVAPAQAAPVRASAGGVPVFVCVAKEDQKHVTPLRKHLALAIKKGLLDLWDPSQIEGGQVREDEIRREFDAARVILLFISANLFSSEECDPLLQKAAERARAGTARVIPIILKSSADLKESPFAGFIALPRDGRPVLSWSDQDAAWAEVAGELRGAIAKLG